MGFPTRWLHHVLRWIDSKFCESVAAAMFEIDEWPFSCSTELLCPTYVWCTWQWAHFVHRQLRRAVWQKWWNKQEIGRYSYRKWTSFPVLLSCDFIAVRLAQIEYASGSKHQDLVSIREMVLSRTDRISFLIASHISVGISVPIIKVALLCFVNTSLLTDFKNVHVR